VAELGAGDVIVHGGTDSKSAGDAGGPQSVTRYNVSWGFAEVLGDRVTILAADALKPEEIDVPRAQEQLARGHKEWDKAGDREEAYTEALRVIAEAEAKIASAAEKH
jgi:F-type H+-transporting ATPase subunit epsilon